MRLRFGGYASEGRQVTVVRLTNGTSRAVEKNPSLTILTIFPYDQSFPMLA